jgi:tetratricopeptide (TPR) repeat protein
VADSLLAPLTAAFRQLQDRRTADPEDAALIPEARALADRAAALRVRLADYLALTPVPSFTTTSARFDQNRRLLDDLDGGARALADNVQETIWRRRLNFFVESGHNEPKFRLFMRALAEVMLYRDDYLAHDVSFDSLRVAALQRLPIRERLAAEGWETEFRQMLEAINALNLVPHDKILRREQRANVILSSEQAEERQPYSHLLKGFDALAAGNRIQAHDELKQVFEETTDFDFMEKVHRWVRALEPPARDVSPVVTSSLNAALHQWTAGDRADAATQFLSVVRTDTTYNHALFYAGLAHKAQGDAERALAYFDHVAARDTTHALALLHKADLLFAQGRYDEVIATADTALTRMRTSWMAHYLRGRAYLALGDYEAAYLALEQRCKPLQKEHFRLRLLLGDVFRLDENMEAAHSEYYNAHRLAITQTQRDELGSREQHFDAGVTFHEPPATMDGAGGGQ